MIQEESINMGRYDPASDELSVRTQRAELPDGAQGEVRLLLGADRVLVGIDVAARNGRFALMIGPHEDVQTTLTVHARFRRCEGAQGHEILIAAPGKYIRMAP